MYTAPPTPYDWDYHATVEAYRYKSQQNRSSSGYGPYNPHQQQYNNGNNMGGRGRGRRRQWSDVVNNNNNNNDEFKRD